MSAGLGYATQFRADPRELALASARSDGHDGIRQALAAADAGDGGGVDESGVEFKRGAPVSRSPVATSTDGLSMWQD